MSTKNTKKRKSKYASVVSEKASSLHKIATGSDGTNREMVSINTEL